MPKLPKSSKSGATPGKLALIAVLAVVLVVVLAVQFGGSFGAGRPAEREERRGESREQRAASGESSPLVTHHSPPATPYSSRPWPKLELADVTDFDPFAAPKPAPEPSETLAATVESAAAQEEQDAAFLEQLRQEGVQAVIGSAHNGRAALIGSQIVRVGDVLGGFRVVGIEPDGVVLERQAGEHTSP